MMRTKQKGFALMEILLVMAMGGILMSFLVPTIFQTTRGTALMSNKVTGSLQVQNAAHWINRDLRMTHSTNLGDGAPAKDNLILHWTDYYDGHNQEHDSRYYLSGDQLQREYDGAISTVARYISDIEFSRDGSVITVVITATPEGAPQRSEKKTYRTALRL